MHRTGGTIPQSLPIAQIAAFLLILLLLYAVREGRFASPGARTAALVAITIVVVLLLWLGPGLFPNR